MTMTDGPLERPTAMGERLHASYDGVTGLRDSVLRYADSLKERGALPEQLEDLQEAKAYLSAIGEDALAAAGLIASTDIPIRQREGAYAAVWNFASQVRHAPFTQEHLREYMHKAGVRLTAEQVGQRFLGWMDRVVSEKRELGEQVTVVKPAELGSSKEYALGQVIAPESRPRRRRAAKKR